MPGLGWGVKVGGHNGWGVPGYGVDGIYYMLVLPCEPSVALEVSKHYGYGKPLNAEELPHHVVGRKSVRPFAIGLGGCSSLDPWELSHHDSSLGSRLAPGGLSCWSV